MLIRRPVPPIRLPVSRPVLTPQVSMSYIWLITNCSSEKARGIGLSILGTVAQTGPLLGTLGLYPSSQAPYYRKGMWTSTGVLFGGVAIALLSISYFVINNRRRDAAALRREGAAEGSGSELGADSKEGDLAAKRQLDMEVPAERAEALRRHIDVSRRGEDSPYCESTVIGAVATGSIATDASVRHSFLQSDMFSDEVLMPRCVSSGPRLPTLLTSCGPCLSLPNPKTCPLLGLPRRPMDSFARL